MPAVSKKQQRYFGYLLSNPEERKKKGISKKAAKDFAQDIQEVSPPGWGHTKAEKEKTKPWKPKSKIGGTAAAFKRALDDGRFKGLPGSKTKKEKTADMFKLMWSMKKKGDHPHYKPGTDKKYKKYQKEEITPSPNVSRKDRTAIDKRFKGLFKKDMKGTVQGVNEDSDDFKDRMTSVLTRATRERGPEGKKNLAKRIGKRRKQEAELERLMRHAVASRGQSDIGEGLSFKKFYDTAKKAVSKKQQERKPQMDSTTRKLHKWRTDKEQAEREKYVTFTKPVEDD